MLGYVLNKNTFGNDTKNIRYSMFETRECGIPNKLYLNVYYSDDECPVEIGDNVKTVSTVKYFDDMRDAYEYVPYNNSYSVYSINTNEKYFTLLIDSYTELKLKRFHECIYNDESTEWEFDFETPHYQDNQTNIELTIETKSSVFNLKGCYSKYSNRLCWIYDEEIHEINVLRNILMSRTRVFDIKILVNQILFIPYQTNDDRVNVEFSVEKYTTSINVPILTEQAIDLYKEGNINEYFVDNNKKNVINSIIDMERIVYIPVSDVDGKYIPINRINFNLHFRKHSGKNWTVENKDGWNCIDNIDNDNYWSYEDKSCQSDLLAYLGFDNNDVKYQKSKLKKSFIRLSFYDSMNQGNQNLLCYSTVYFDTSKFYSKYITNSGSNIYLQPWQTSVDRLIKGCKVNSEVSRTKLNRIIPDADDSTVEDFRLGSQISVLDRWSSKRTSEGFYLYLWNDDIIDDIKRDIYMKVEFNHAGYGRMIPMMAPFFDPYKDGKNGFKTIDEISDDWNNSGYGIKQYLKYSYIRLKYGYDSDNGQHIYFLDPYYYNTDDSGILNINLFEARISYGE